MRYEKKLFIAILGTSVFILTIGIVSFYFFLKKNIEHEYIVRYHSLGVMIGDTFKQLEIITNQLNSNAVRVLSIIEKERGLPNNSELIHLRNQLNVSSLHISDSDGAIIRTTDLYPAMPPENIFNFCKDYRLLIEGKKLLYTTPIIPDSFYNTPAKFLLIPNRDRKLIFESGTQLPYIGKILNNAVSNDLNIKSVGFYTPTGVELGFISRNGEYRNGINKNTQLFVPSNKSHKNTFSFDIKITSSEKYCCECITKKISSNQGEYFNVLRLEISRDALVESIANLRNKAMIILLVTYFLCLFISKWLVDKLVKNISKINQTAKEIIKSNNLDLSVDVKIDNDEISELATNFNKMIRSLKESQEALVDSEKKISLLDLAARVAHDIRSPIGVMEINLQMLRGKITEDQEKTLQEAIQRIRDIANNLLDQYRDPNIVTNNLSSKDDGNIPRHLLLVPLLENMILQKRQEWMHKNCELSFHVDPKDKCSWLCIAPNEFNRLLSNLLNNAYEAIGDQGEIELSLFKREAFLELKIIDNGMGIDEDKIPLVLNGLSLKHPGRGFGLSEAKKCMEKLGGKLQLLSQQRKGTEVTLKFPIPHNEIESNYIKLNDLVEKI